MARALPDEGLPWVVWVLSPTEWGRGGGGLQGPTKGIPTITPAVVGMTCRINWIVVF